jgi:hypothetical protein
MNSDTRYKVCTVASWTQNLNTFIGIVKHFYCFYQTFNQIRFPTEFENNSTDFTPLRLIVAGSAGCGKSYLIKCLVKAVKMFYNSNKSVQVLCPTGNSANLISGVTIHSFLVLSNTAALHSFKTNDPCIDACDLALHLYTGQPKTGGN